MGTEKGERIEKERSIYLPMDEFLDELLLMHLIKYLVLQWKPILLKPKVSKYNKTKITGIVLYCFDLIWCLVFVFLWQGV